MSVNRFELETIPADVQARNLNGYELTELGYAVNKFDAASTSPTLVTDNVETAFASITGVTVNATTRTITFDGTARAALAGVGTTHGIGWKVIITGNGRMTTAGAAGVNINWWNCNIVVEDGIGTSGSTDWTIGCSNAATDTAGADIRSRQTAGTDASVASSINMYGCTLNILDSGCWMQWSDAIDTTFLNPPTTAVFRLGTGQGGRWIRFSLKNNDLSPISSYGAITQSEVISDQISYVIGNNGAGIPTVYLFDRQAWQDPTQPSYIAMNSPNDVDGRALVLGGPFFGSTEADAWGTGGTGARVGGSVSSDDISARAAGGVMQYTAIAPTYLDAVTREPVQGISVRLITNMSHGGFLTGDPTWNARIGSSDPSATLRTGNEGVTGPDGRLRTARRLTSSNSGGSYTEVDGYFDYLQWVQEDTVDQTNFGTGINGDAGVASSTAPLGMMIAPISRYWYDAGVQLQTYTNSQVRRGYTHNVDISEGIAIPGAKRNPVYVDDAEIVVENLVGTLVKEENVLNGAPSITFSQTAPVSVNDIRDAYRSRWYSHDFDVSNGNTHTRNIALTIDPTATNAVTGTANAVNIQANGIANTTGDLFFQDVNFTSGTFNNTGISGNQSVRFSNIVTGFGGVSNGASIQGLIIALGTGASNGGTFITDDITAATITSFTDNVTFQSRTDDHTNVTFTGLTPNATYSIEQLFGTNVNVADGETIEIRSNVNITVSTEDARFTASNSGGGTVTLAAEAARIDFSALIAADPTFFTTNSAIVVTGTATSASSLQTTSAFVTAADLVDNVYTWQNLQLNVDYAVAVTKPGYTNFREVFTFVGGNTITPVLNTIDAVDPAVDLKGASITNARIAGGLTLFGLSGATTANALDGPQTVFVTELVKGQGRYGRDVLENKSVNITHTSNVTSAWDETVFRLEPITSNQQVTGISSITVGNPNPVQDNGSLSIFINGPTEVNYNTIDDLFDANVAPLVSEVDEGFDQMARWMDTGNLRKANKVTTGRTI